MHIETNQKRYPKNMCTALSFVKHDFYFGRTLDLEFSYHETVTVAPRNFPLPFRMLPAMKKHHALIGMAYVQDGYPLYYEAVNEKGLGMAGLNFPVSARYFPPAEGKENVAPFEFIPYILGSCASVKDAREKIGNMHLAAISFSEKLPLSPLHWMISDRDGSIVVEPTADGLKVYDDPAGVMTNEPPFDCMMDHLANYMSLSPEPPNNNFSYPLTAYSRGLGGMGLPGDLSSASRFVKAAFVKEHSRCGESESEAVGQFFHILGSVEQQRGCVRLKGGDEITVYTSCCNADKGLYYYTTYTNRRINRIDMHGTDLNAEVLTSYPLREAEDIFNQN